MSLVHEELINNLVKFRIKNGFTQKDIAAILEISNVTVGMWEMGKRGISIVHIIKLAELYDVSLDEFVLSRSSKQIQSTELKKLRIIINELEEIYDQSTKYGD
ncbi:helix-turn-helix transcriptional regulator [Streptococcus pluranimalium]|uniref:helix-turn-helix domain-containing protein n=1 Tax=Streptococcus pluranimalium TaxID=82348 RepID=UPI0031395572